MPIFETILQRNYGQTKIVSQNRHENSIQKTAHVTWPELADYFLDAFDWYRGGKVGEIANTLID